MQEDRRQFDNAVDTELRDLSDLEDKIANKLEQEITVSKLELNTLNYFSLKVRKEGEGKLIKIIEDNLSLIRMDISKEAKIRSEILDNLNQALEVI